MNIFNPQPNFKLIGHRGVAGLRPENTLCSFAYAAALGLNWIEFDVQLSKNDKWVVIHDATVDRTTSHSGKVVEYSAAELGLMQAGMWFNPPYPRQPIPTLDLTLLLASKLGLQCNIEIKNSTLDPMKYARLMEDYLRIHKPAASGMPMISSFELPCLKILRKLMPTLPIAYLVDEFTADTVMIAEEHHFASINCDVKTITTENISVAAKSNIPVLLFTINDPAVATYWFNEGVAAVFTDHPDLLLNVIPTK